MPRRARKLLTVSTLIAATASLILIAIVYGAYLSSQRSAALAQTAYDVSFAELRLSRAFNILLEAESSQRGYLLTHDESYLEPFLTYRRRAGDELDQAEQQMGKLAMGAAGPALEQLRETIDRKLSELDETVALGKAGRQDEALAIVRGNLGRDLMSRARDMVADQLLQLADLRSARIGEAQTSARRLTMLTALGVFAVVVLSLIAIIRFSRSSAALAQAQDELEDANEALEERVRERTRGLQAANEEIQRYAYIVSHDLRAPLVNIIGFSKELGEAMRSCAAALASPGLSADDPVIAQARLAVEEDAPEALKFIEASTTRMDNLINAILALSRLGRMTLQPRDVDLEDLTRRCADSIQHRLNESGAVFAVEGRLPHIVGDVRAIEQILANLLDNAAKYLAPERPGRIVVRARRLGAKCLLEVEDNGRGVAPDDHERIFELFRRAGRQDQPGDGIGLAHVRSLARRLGGEIIVKSDGRTGSLFIVSLPSDLRRAIAEGIVNE